MYSYGSNNNTEDKLLREHILIKMSDPIPKEEVNTLVLLTLHQRAVRTTRKEQETFIESF